MASGPGDRGELPARERHTAIVVGGLVTTIALGVFVALGPRAKTGVPTTPPPSPLPLAPCAPASPGAARVAAPSEREPAADEGPAPIGVFRADGPSAPFGLMALTADGHFLRSQKCGGPVDHGVYHLRALRDATVMGMRRVVAFEDDRLHEQIDVYVYALDDDRMKIERLPTHQGFTMTRARGARLLGAGEACDPADCAYCAPPLGCNQDRHVCE